MIAVDSHQKRIEFDWFYASNQKEYTYKSLDPNFFIVRFPYACSNIPSKIFLSTIGAETLRICRASSCFEHFIRFCQPFFNRMINQGANVREIKSVFVKFFKRHETIFSKFNKTSEQIIVELKF